jgi:hypothetical protein
MRSLLVLACLTASVAAALGTVSCSQLFDTGQNEQNPGTALGAYAITANVDPTSTCAEMEAQQPVPWNFSVNLSYSGTVAYWNTGGDPLGGEIDSSGNLTFATSSDTHVHDANKATGVGSCDIIRADNFTGTLVTPPTPDAGVGPASFTGTLRYTYSVAPGSDCSDVVGPITATRTAPLFSVIPCYLGFAVSATRTGNISE